ncbi:MAG: hypothetical protein JRI23_32785 [Deltaproteobacteria bacterium]|jgi:hypothetical protein|nr:hypothetical protein [Deltaproteobacteria bacterium]MBW2537029.1 hypothetical protein [Deltaproteobacteria bacterium]
MGRSKKKDGENRPEIEITIDEEEVAVPLSRPPAGGSMTRQTTSAYPPPPAGADPSKPYGIEQVIELLADLPTDQNSDLVAVVVRKTLESAHISIEAILEDARNREADFQQRIEMLTRAIEEMQEEIASRRKHVAELQKKRKELLKARDLLAAAFEKETKEE